MADITKFACTRVLDLLLVLESIDHILSSKPAGIQLKLRNHACRTSTCDAADQDHENCRVHNVMNSCSKTSMADTHELLGATCMSSETDVRARRSETYTSDHVDIVGRKPRRSCTNGSHATDCRASVCENFFGSEVRLFVCSSGNVAMMIFVSHHEP